MKVIRSIVVKTTIIGALTYILGFFFLYPIFAKFTAGDNPHAAIAVSAMAIHKAIYHPLLKELGPEHPVSQAWFRNAQWWCNKINGVDECRGATQ